ncbi:hypothetical protein GIB67_017642 [Kingdonia uniflora]|uniref:Protein NUCLEAR FUSION DEFECTIVE 6, chloroplastic/mitochondrial n=1 Tax=Kingdonia uniflora TaxID=39325 RepID=A0A7J7LNG3_9MAGN|nr:hypothetical protein GIB67_017642 [Kingdonia uniflora]
MASCAKSLFRSAPIRNAAARFTAPPSRASPFRLPNQKPLSNRIFRSPVEMSCCVDSLMPFHTATASSLLTSMLAVSRPGCGWLIEGLGMEQITLGAKSQLLIMKLSPFLPSLTYSFWRDIYDAFVSGLYDEFLSESSLLPKEI